MGSLELVKAGAKVLEPGEQTLAELAETANYEHGLAQQGAETAFEHAILAGRALSAAHVGCPRGTWMQWLRDNFSGSWSSAWIYRRLAEYEAVVRADPQIRTISQALKIVGGLPEYSVPEETKREARRLYEDGASQADIGRLFGVAQTTVGRWLDPALTARNIARTNRRRKQREREQAALREIERAKAIKRAVQKAGAATAEAWAMAERMQDVLAQAQRETEDSEARRALSQAGVHYRKMRDEIVRALGVS